MFHFVVAGAPMKKFRGEASQEREVRDIWERAMGFVPLDMGVPWQKAAHEEECKKGVYTFNYMPEVFICQPAFPIYCGIADGFFYDKEGQPIIYECKGIIKNVVLFD